MSEPTFDRDGKLSPPDPSTATTAMLLREVQSLKELIFSRLDANERAVVVFNDVLTAFPTQLQSSIAGLREMLDERFRTERETFKTVDEKLASIQTQFRERDTRSSQESLLNKTAVDAAFAAQKESAAEQRAGLILAIDKSEAAVKETLTKQADLFTSSNDSLRRELGDMKERLTRIEGMGLGNLKEYSDVNYGAGQARQATGSQSWLALGLIVTVVLSLLATATGIIIAMVK